MCKHEFVGHAGGVKCSLCGTEMTTQEYRAFLKGEDKEPATTEPVKAETPKAPSKPKQAPKKTTKSK